MFKNITLSLEKKCEFYDFLFLLFSKIVKLLKNLFVARLFYLQKIKKKMENEHFMLISLRGKNEKTEKEKPTHVASSFISNTDLYTVRDCILSDHSYLAKYVPTNCSLK